MFAKILAKWLAQKAVPVRGNGVIHNRNSDKRLNVKGVLDFTGNQPVLITDIDNTRKKLPVAVVKVEVKENGEELLYCLHVSPDNPQKWMIFAFQRDVNIGDENIT